MGKENPAHDRYVAVSVSNVSSFARLCGGIVCASVINCASVMLYTSSTFDTLASSTHRFAAMRGHAFMHSLILLGAIRERRQRYLGEQVQEVDGSEAGFLQKWLFLLTFRSPAKRARRGDGWAGQSLLQGQLWRTRPHMQRDKYRRRFLSLAHRRVKIIHKHTTFSSNTR